MRCIPRQLLIHSVWVSTPVSEDCFGGIIYGEEIKLHYVRVDFSEEEDRSGFNLKSTGQTTLIYDCLNSQPLCFEFKHGQRVKWEDRLFSVTAVKKLYDKSRLHHIEVNMEEIRL